MARRTFLQIGLDFPFSCHSFFNFKRRIFLFTQNFFFPSFFPSKWNCVDNNKQQQQTASESIQRLCVGSDDCYSHLSDIILTLPSFYNHMIIFSFHDNDERTNDERRRHCKWIAKQTNYRISILLSHWEPFTTTTRTLYGRLYLIQETINKWRKKNKKKKKRVNVTGPFMHSSIQSIQSNPLSLTTAW